MKVLWRRRKTINNNNAQEISDSINNTISKQFISTITQVSSDDLTYPYSCEYCNVKFPDMCFLSIHKLKHIESDPVQLKTLLNDLTNVNNNESSCNSNRNSSLYS